MPKRKLLPDGIPERGMLIVGEAVLLVMLGILLTWVPRDGQFVPSLVLIGGLMVGLWVWIYFIQELPEDELGQYTIMIADLEVVGAKLSQLVRFLEQERERILVSEATLRQLQDEKAKLEPVVLTQREAVNAILSAHAKTTASRAWKERILGFMSGVLASLLAAILFELLRHP